jgi:erythromycin esterase-like protein
MARPQGRPAKVPNEDGEWKCSKCNQYKPASDFYKSRSTKNGLANYCKDCMQGYHRTHLNKQRLENYRLQVQDLYPETTPMMRQSLVEAYTAVLDCDPEKADTLFALRQRHASIEAQVQRDCTNAQQLEVARESRPQVGSVDESITDDVFAAFGLAGPAQPKKVGEYQPEVWGPPPG